MGKGSKERLVPLAEEAIGWISRYLNEARPQLKAKREPEALFVTRAWRRHDAAGVLAP